MSNPIGTSRYHRTEKCPLYIFFFGKGHSAEFCERLFMKVLEPGWGAGYKATGLVDESTEKVDKSFRKFSCERGERNAVGDGSSVEIISFIFL